MSITFNLYRNFDGTLDGRYKQGNKPSATSPVQLPATNYVTRVADPELIFPRPDNETPAWAKHRRHHPSVPYRIPIGISFGSWPFYFEAISMPTGATVGSWLTTSGDKLIVGDDYGVVEWLNPTVGNHSFHIKVHFQDGYAPLDVQWTLEVTTAGTIFIDAVSGNDSTGDGTIGNPFQTIESWWLGDEQDATYREYQVCYRGGTHNVAADNTLTGITGGNWQLNGTDKPLVHYGYQGENVIFDMSDTTIVCGFTTPVAGVSASDCWFSNIEFNGGPVARNNPRQFFFAGESSSATTYTAGGNGQRNTWFECTHKDFVNVTTAADNSGVLWAPNTTSNEKRHYWAVIRADFTNVRYNTGVFLNFNGFYLSQGWNYLGEHITCTNTNFGKGPVTCKSSANRVCSRNHDYSAAPDQIFGMNLAGSYDSTNAEVWELSYSRINMQLTATVDVCLFVNQSNVTYDSVGQNHHPVQVYRNTFSRAPDDGGAIRTGGWDVVMKNNVLVADSAFYLTPENSNSADTDDYLLYSVASNPLDTNLNLTGSERTTYLGQYGAEVAE